MGKKHTPMRGCRNSIFPLRGGGRPRVDLGAGAYGSEFCATLQRQSGVARVLLCRQGIMALWPIGSLMERLKRLRTSKILGGR